MAVLDWGLGHATRCVPVIRALGRLQREVVIAGSGDALVVLQKEFPELRSVELPAYRPRYPRKGSAMAWAMISQLPRFIKVIAAEHRVVEAMVRAGEVGLIISDNRYGCWSKKVRSIFITHQSNILMPKRFGWLHRVVRRVNEKLINRFSMCWIPDFPETHALAGAMVASGMRRLKTEVRHIGWLSRFEGGSHLPVKYDVALILSGPEPQRTLFEEIVLPQLRASGMRYRVVRGLPSATASSTDENTVNFMTSAELQECIQASDVIIARSGYSTVMDMHALGKKVIFVPTPGQPEQEYLAKRLESKGIAFYVTQDKFDLATAMVEQKHYSGFTAPPGNRLLLEAITAILDG